MKKFALTILVSIGCYSFASAQVTAQADASATIVTPISISWVQDMNFGNVAVSTAPGTVILAPAGTRNKSGGVTLPATPGSPAAARFTVEGEAAYTYAITLPTSITITDGTNDMTVNAFTSTPNGTGLLSAGSPGSQTLNVGATLNVNGSQPAGAYATTTPFDVTVNYN